LAKSPLSIANASFIGLNSGPESVPHSCQLPSQSVSEWAALKFYNTMSKFEIGPN